MGPRYRTVTGILLVAAAIGIGVAAAQLLEGRVPMKPGALGCLGAGAVLFGVDLLIRRFSREPRFWFRYFGTRASLSLYGALPIWILGFTLLVAALSFPTP
ncbi:MAG: hypothetical protein EOO73_07045 [Myxococcales bacterium]|nr:MAG: hypothetical protein EOO73_07045 [Myxococcales bacterium]